MSVCTRRICRIGSSPITAKSADPRELEGSRESSFIRIRFGAIQGHTDRNGVGKSSAVLRRIRTKLSLFLSHRQLVDMAEILHESDGGRDTDATPSPIFFRTGL